MLAMRAGRLRGMGYGGAAEEAEEAEEERELGEGIKGVEWRRVGYNVEAAGK